jgi:hypothetical protein
LADSPGVWRKRKSRIKRKQCHRKNALRRPNKYLQKIIGWLIFCKPVLWLRIRRICTFLDLTDPDPSSFVRIHNTSASNVYKDKKKGGIYHLPEGFPSRFCMRVNAFVTGKRTASTYSMKFFTFGPALQPIRGSASDSSEHRSFYRELGSRLPNDAKTNGANYIEYKSNSRHKL